MPIALFNLGKDKTLAVLAIVSLGCLFLQIGAPAGARRSPLRQPERTFARRGARRKED
jgi:hypothetical protein